MPGKQVKNSTTEIAVRIDYNIYVPFGKEDCSYSIVFWIFLLLKAATIFNYNAPYNTTVEAEVKGGGDYDESDA